jgi:hypothetical protein
VVKGLPLGRKNPGAHEAFAAVAVQSLPVSPVANSGLLAIRSAALGLPLKRSVVILLRLGAFSQHQKRGERKDSN